MILLLECGSESQGNPALASLCPSLGSHQQVILCFSFFIYKMGMKNSVLKIKNINISKYIEICLAYNSYINAHYVHL